MLDNQVKQGIFNHFSSSLIGQVSLDVWLEDKPTIARVDQDECIHCDDVKNVSKEISNLHPNISGGAAVAGISTRAWVSGGIGAASTVTCSADAGGAGNVSGNVDIISFMVHYLGGTNTDLNQYKIYVTGQTGFNQGGHGV